MTFRAARRTDLEALVALERACYPPNQAYSAQEYRYALYRAKAVNVVWTEEGAITGFIGAFHHRAWKAGHIYTVNVHPSQRGKGLGMRLLAECERRLRKLGMTRCILEVNVDNAAAIALYEKAGYALVERLPGYYTQYANNDALRYEKAL